MTFSFFTEDLGGRLCALADPAVYKAAKTGQCRRDTGSPGLHRESSFQKGGPNRILALLGLNLARLPPPLDPPVIIGT